MAEELVEIILQAIDNASSVFGSVSQSAEEIGTTMTEVGSEASSSFDEIDSSASTATGSIQDVIDYCQGIDGSGPRDAAGGMDELESATSTADTAVEDLGTDLDIINAGMLLQTAEQISAIAGNAEGMAQEMNTAAISVGQLATQTGVAEPQMVSLVNTISNATFPNDEAMMYIKSLDQMGVSSENLGASATNLDKINDAFGLGAQTVNSLGQELGVLGVDMNNVSSAFNALAYANANTVGGMENYYSFLRKYDSQFKELGYNVDQASVIIAAATQKFGGGRAALSGLSKALEESAGDSRKLEEALGMQAGSIDNATALTSQYEGQLQQLADEEAEHKTLLDQLGAAWEDVSLAMSGVLSPLGSAVGLIGEVGSFGMQVNGLKMLGSSLKGVVSGIRSFNLAKTMQNVLEGEGAIASVAAALGITTEAAAAEGATVAFGGLAIAEGAALWPILAIIAAIGLLVLAVYEIGKAFNWWDDVGTMIEAISDGLQRMWNAFVNHPDVQAVIGAISSAWNGLTSAIGNAWNGLMEFFGLSTDGSFDIVRALIEGIGLAWQIISEPIRTVIELVGMVIGVFQEFSTGQLDLVGIVLNVINTLVTGWINLNSQISTIMITLMANLLTWAIQAGLNVLTGLATYLSQVPIRVYTYLMNTLNYFISLGARWVSTARQKANQVVSGIVSFLRQLPGKALSALLGVVSSIVNAGAQWVSNARSKASEVVSNVVSTLSGLPGKISGALSGVVDAIVGPFKKAYNDVKGVVDNIISKASEVANISLPTGWGGETAYGGETALPTFSSDGGTVIRHESEPIEVNVNENITLDLVNVPGHIDTNALITMLSDREVLRSLTGNKDFQSLDAKVKEQLNFKVNRSRGI